MIRIFNQRIHEPRKYIPENSMLYKEMRNRLTKELSSICFTYNPSIGQEVFMVDNKSIGHHDLYFTRLRHIGCIEVDETNHITSIEIFDWLSNIFTNDYHAIIDKYIGVKICKPRKNNK